MSTPRKFWTDAFRPLVIVIFISGFAEAAPQRTFGQPSQQATIHFRQLAEDFARVPPLLRSLEVAPPEPQPIPQGDVKTESVLPKSGTGRAPERDGAPNGPLDPSPGASPSFLAIDDNNSFIPPDTHGAVGPNHLMTVLNSQVRIQNRSGGIISTMTLNAFWSSVGNPNVFDPKAFYDPYNDRWIFGAVANAATNMSVVLIGVSRTPDPTGIWNLYRIDADPVTRNHWADYPSIGFNRNWITVQVNIFPNAGGSFTRTQIYAFDKFTLYAGAFQMYTLFTDATIGGTQSPAVTYDNSDDTLYLLQEWNRSSGGRGFLRIYTITGAIGSEVLGPPTARFASIPDPWSGGAIGGADFAPQLGSVRKIDTGDDRMLTVVFRNGSLWATHTVFLPAGGSPNRSSVQWWQINPTNGVVLQESRIDDPSANVFYAYPSIAVNRENDALIGYSRFSASQYASANYSLRTSTDPINTLRDDALLKAGEASYYKTYSGTRNRWGDYSNTAVDPVNDTDMWTIQEYATTPGGGRDRWATWWGRIVSRYAISGQVADSGSVGVNQVLATLTGTQGGSTLTDGNGNYSFVRLPVGGNFVVTPTKDNYVFNPPSQSVGPLNQDATANFTATFVAADMALGASADHDPVSAGDTLVYTLTVTNNGPSAANMVTVESLLDGNSLTFVSCSATGGGVCSGDVDQFITWPGFSNGETETITITATVNDTVQSGDTFHDTSTVSSQTFDPDLSNNATDVLSNVQ